MDVTARVLTVLFFFFAAMAIGESGKRAQSSLERDELAFALVQFRSRLQVVDRRIDRAMSRAREERARLRMEPSLEEVGPGPTQALTPTTRAPGGPQWPSVGVATPGPE